jgi:uncharacterized cupin superfamily protein
MSHVVCTQVAGRTIEGRLALASPSDELESCASVTTTSVPDFTGQPKAAGIAVTAGATVGMLRRLTNIDDPVFDEPREHPGFCCRRARLGRQAGSERLGLSLWELPAGEAAYPYHYHLAEEELVLVLEGQPSLRSVDGWRELQQGEVVSFLRGEHGGHQLVNRTQQTVRFLSFSTSGEPDIVIYPDSNKLGAFERLPTGGGLYALFGLDSTVDYHDGEQPPS